MNITWVFFRAENFENAFGILKSMADLRSFKYSEEFVNTTNYLLNWPFLNLKGENKTNNILTIETLEYVLFFGFICLTLPNTMEIINKIKYRGRLVFRPNLLNACICALLFFFALMKFTGNTSHSEFLYFNF